MGFFGDVDGASFEGTMSCSMVMKINSTRYATGRTSVSPGKPFSNQRLFSSLVTFVIYLLQNLWHDAFPGTIQNRANQASVKNMNKREFRKVEKGK